MAEFQKKKKWKRNLYSKTVLVGLAGLIVGTIFGIIDTIPKNREAFRNKANAEREYELLKAQEEALQAKIEKLKTEEGIEENLRDKFRVVKEGEGLIVIVDEPETGAEEEAPEESGFRSFLKRFR